MMKKYAQRTCATTRKRCKKILVVRDKVGWGNLPVVDYHEEDDQDKV